MTATPTQIIESLRGRDLKAIPTAELRKIAASLLDIQQTERRECNLIYYEPASDRVRKVHSSRARLIGVSGGNGSSKTESVLAEICALATGIIPASVQADLRPKFRGPIAVRIVLESLTTTLYPVILPKLMWHQWTGQHPQGGPKGHWGWIPKMCLINGEWEKSWSDKIRTLTVVCRDPDNHTRILGRSTIQFMSHEQDPSDFASGDYHIVMMDEPPKYSIFRECQARTMRVDGRMFLAMTWPDDPSIPVDWIYDEVYEKGLEGPNKHPEVDWIELWTIENKNLNQDAIASQMSLWSEETRRVRIYGQPIRFSNRIHPLFTDIPQVWSFRAGKTVIPQGGRCPETGSEDIITYCHVREFDLEPSWPVVFILDPHPRKPHMFSWWMVDPSNDYWCVAEGEVAGEAPDVKAFVDGMEESLGMNVQMRIMDPNMARQPVGGRRDAAWQDEFDNAGLRCDLADSSDVGRSRVNEYLKPDPHRLQPRLHWHPRCQNAVLQMKRFVWDNFRNQSEKDLKQRPKEKYDDYPAMARYLMNALPSFDALKQPIRAPRTAGIRRGAY